MIRNRKSAYVGTSLFFVVAALGLYAYTRAHAAPTYRLANGIKVTPLEVQPDDVAKVLDVKIWKFDVSMPDAKQILDLRLNLYQGGKVIRSLGGSGLAPTERQSLGGHIVFTIVMAPDDKDFYHGKQIKYLLESKTGTTSNKFANPFQHSSGMGDGPDVSEAENSIYLVGGGKTATSPRFSDMAIALTITSEKPLQ